MAHCSPTCQFTVSWETQKAGDCKQTNVVLNLRTLPDFGLLPRHHRHTGTVLGFPRQRHGEEYSKLSPAAGCPSSEQEEVKERGLAHRSSRERVGLFPPGSFWRPLEVFLLE